MADEINAVASPEDAAAQAVQDQHDENAFAAGFATARGEEPPPVAEPAPVATAEVVAEIVPEAPKAVLAGLTEDQIRVLLAKAGEVDSVRESSEQRIRQVFGKLGEVNSLVQKLQESRGSGVKLTSDSLKRMRDEFPAMAELLAEDLNEALANVGGPAVVDDAAIERIVTARLAAKEDEINRRLEKRWLSQKHDDWEAVVKTPEFALWAGNVLDKETATKLQDSWDANFVASQITSFKEWRAKTTKNQESRQKRLEAAVSPQGTRPPEQTSISDDDAFLAGYNAVRGVRL